MNKAIMISGKPKWSAKIANGDKTIEVRVSKALASAIQKLINEYGHADIYWYCSMAKHIKDYLQIENGKYVCDVPKDYKKTLNGKVIFKFRCYKVENIFWEEDPSFDENYSRVCELYCRTSHLDNYELTNKASLSNYEISEYLQDKNGYATNGYAINISDLEIFDKPKELGEFYNIIPSKLPLTRDIKYLTKAPQNFCYVEELL